MKRHPELSALGRNTSLPRGMTRREMVQHVLGATSAGLALPAASQAVRKHPTDHATQSKAEAQAASWSPSFLDPHQNETLIVLAERIVPGSSRAQVNRFIDLALSADSRENEQNFLNALAAFEGESLQRFGHPFKDLSEAQQIELLTIASTAQPNKTQGRRDTDWIANAAKSASEAPALTLRDRFDTLKRWVSGAYYSSEIGMRELGWTGEHFFESFPGCPHPEGHS